MKALKKIVPILLLIVAIAGVVHYKQVGNAAAPAGSAGAADAAAKNDAISAAKPLPKLVDLGADKCIPCKAMAPVLEELKEENGGKLEVVFVDVWKYPEEAKVYEFNLIPTQLFFNAEGKEVFRHEGFLSKEDILAKWKELGVDLSASGA